MPGNADYRKASHAKHTSDRSREIATDRKTTNDDVFVDSAEKQIREAEADADRREFISDGEVEKLRAILRG